MYSCAIALNVMLSMWRGFHLQQNTNKQQHALDVWADVGAIGGSLCALLPLWGLNNLEGFQVPAQEDINMGAPPAQAA